MADSSPNGLIVLDKPNGLSSNRALERVKRLLGSTGRGKAGFLGTLDPLATGVLPVFLGKFTKLISLFEGMEKTYRVTLRLGQCTDTFDAEGAIVREADPSLLSGLSEERVRTVASSFQGETVQRVPRFSAVKIGGVPAYKLARAGRDVPAKVRNVHLRNLTVTELALPFVTFEVTCSAGAYMRALANDIGETLQVGAHVHALRRLACGCLFTLENSITLEGVEEKLAASPGEGSREFLLNPARFLPGYLPLTVEDDAERRLRDGQVIPLLDPQENPREDRPPTSRDRSALFHPPAKVKALRPCGTLVAIGEVVRLPGDSLGFRPAKVLV